MPQFLLTAHDYTDAQALERRLAARPAHFERMADLKKAGHFVFGGAILDEADRMIGSSIVFNFETEADVYAYLKTEPYVLGAVWSEVKISKMRVAQIPD